MVAQRPIRSPIRSPLKMWADVGVLRLRKGSYCTTCRSRLVDVHSTRECHFCWQVRVFGDLFKAEN